MQQLQSSMVYTGFTQHPKMFKVHRSEDGELHDEIGMIKIYTAGIDDLHRRIAWFNKIDHLNARDPLECRGCGKHVKEGDRVLTRPGRRYNHIYHLPCARKNKVI